MARWFGETRVAVQSDLSTDRKPPEKPVPTDSECAKLFKSVIGHTGAYRVADGKIIVRADASWIQSCTGIDRAQIVENRLIITATVKAPSDGRELLVTNVWERVE
jgi:Lipocalin-like domain